MNNFFSGFSVLYLEEELQSWNQFLHKCDGQTTKLFTRKLIFFHIWNGDIDICPAFPV